MQQDVVTVGVDLAKNVFQVHAIGADGKGKRPVTASPQTGR